MIKTHLFETEYKKLTKDFLKLNIPLKINILLVTKTFQATETWENLTKGRKVIKNKRSTQ